MLSEIETSVSFDCQVFVIRRVQPVFEQSFDEVIVYFGKRIFKNGK